jgi:large subunit ribosomal protein L31
MKEDIHPTWYPEARVTCACGNTWVTGSTVPEIRTDVCSNCHPFYTGEQRIVDTEGQVDRFLKRLQARDDILAAADAQAEARTSPDLPVAELEIGTRYVNVLAEAKVTTAGDILDLLNEGGDEALLAIKGFGHKGLIDMKRRMRARGYELPE